MLFFLNKDIYIYKRKNLAKILVNTFSQILHEIQIQIFSFVN